MHANLTGANLEKIQKLEKEIGVVLIAKPRYKNLAEGDLTAIGELEKKTGSLLVAYEA